jgi:cephalosporin hydroxylase
MNHPAQDPHCTYWTDGDASTPVFQRPAEFDQLLALYLEKRPRRVLEIGTYYGGTLKQWLRRGWAERVVAVDLFLPRYDPRTKAGEWAQESGVEFVAFAGNSHDPAIVEAVRQLGPFDWICIDADHYYAPALRDWVNYGAMCAPGGVVVLHDIVACPVRHPEIEVPKLWAEIKADGHRTIEFVEDYAAPWGGLGIVLP